MRVTHTYTYIQLGLTRVADTPADDWYGSKNRVARVFQGASTTFVCSVFVFSPVGIDIPDCHRASISSLPNAEAEFLGVFYFICGAGN